MPNSVRQIEAPVPQHPRPVEAPNHHFRWDLTVNIPTVITLVSLTIGIASFGVTKYVELTKADDSNAVQIRGLRVDVDKIFLTQQGVVREMREGLDTIRKENREDFKEVRGGLDRITDRLPGVVMPNPQSIQGWTK